MDDKDYLYDKLKIGALFLTLLFFTEEIAPKMPNLIHKTFAFSKLHF